MGPLELIYCSLAAIGITVIYTGWHRYWLARFHRPDQLLRERVAYMLWVAASKH
jgi:hypothetical protein